MKVDYKNIDSNFTYDGHDLGCYCDNKGTGFKVWAPFAHTVELVFFENGTETKAFFMQKEASGVWTYNTNENYYGEKYLYRVHGEQVTMAVDPYAKAVTANGEYSVVMDLTKTNPIDFDQDIAPKRENEDVIYELHVRDFSWDSSIGGNPEYRGKYKAFSEDWAINSDSKGLKYLKNLGITHIQLMPIYDYGWLDETNANEQYNWGYDPVNYNVPEGSYATDLEDAATRIRECKEMIMSIHKAGLRVVMDVVYNHTFDLNNGLEKTAPGYYYRQLEDGSLANGSACGNDTASGRSMVDNYIVDSVLYWAREYHIDGFRFDLMGLMTTELMNRIRIALDEEFGKGEKIMYGEPWSADFSPTENNTHKAYKDSVQFLDDGVGVFCDGTRDVIKGSVFKIELPGFVNGGSNLEASVLDAVSGWVDSQGEIRPKSCNQIIQYLSAHDNFTLWDKLLLSMKPGEIIAKEDFDNTYEDIIDANKLAAFMYMTCQGHLFMQAGEEFARTKYGDENSYRSASEINMLDWKRVEKYSELVEYYKGLISLRKKLPGLFDKTREAALRVTNKTIIREKTVSFMVNNDSESVSTDWSQVLVVYNADDSDCEIVLEEGEWVILADKDKADCRIACENSVLVKNKSGLMVGKKRR